jgi:hypothetical protein
MASSWCWRRSSPSDRLAGEDHVDGKRNPEISKIRPGMPTSLDGSEQLLKR